MWDETFERWVMAASCPCCHKCWRYISDGEPGRCVHGGPYKGYIEVPDDHDR